MRIFSPLNQIHIGNGIPMTIASPASSELPPPYPSLAYICSPNSGKAKPRRDRNTDAADKALAAYVNASMRYSWIGKLECPLVSKLRNERRVIKYTHKVVIMPKPKIPDPIIGMIQWSAAWADHPYQLRRFQVLAIARGLKWACYSQQANGHEERTENKGGYSHFRFAFASIFIGQLL